VTYLCDTNVFIALLLEGHPRHKECAAWFETVPQAGEVVMCRPVQLSVLRLLTTTAVLERLNRPPLTNAQAWAVIEATIADERIRHDVDEPPGLDALWSKFALRKTASPKLWMDGFLAAWASASKWILVSTDDGFAQFKGVETINLNDSATEPPN